MLSATEFTTCLPETAHDNHEGLGYRLETRGLSVEEPPQCILNNVWCFHSTTIMYRSMFTAAHIKPHCNYMT